MFSSQGRICWLHVFQRYFLLLSLRPWLPAKYNAEKKCDTQSLQLRSINRHPPRLFQLDSQRIAAMPEPLSQPWLVFEVIMMFPRSEKRKADDLAPHGSHTSETNGQIKITRRPDQVTQSPIRRSTFRPQLSHYTKRKITGMQRTGRNTAIC